MDEITHPKKRAFLENYPKFIRATKTAKAIGIDESTHYIWLNTDENYYQAFQELKKRIDSERLEVVEAEIYDRSMDREAFGSSTLLIFQAKALNPEKYREKPPETRLVGDVTVKLAVPAYSDTPIMIEEPKKQLEEGTDADRSS